MCFVRWYKHVSSKLWTMLGSIIQLELCWHKLVASAIHHSTFWFTFTSSKSILTKAITIWITPQRNWTIWITFALWNSSEKVSWLAGFFQSDELIPTIKKDYVIRILLPSQVGNPKVFKWQTSHFMPSTLFLQLHCPLLSHSWLIEPFSEQLQSGPLWCM